MVSSGLARVRVLVPKGKWALSVPRALLAPSAYSLGSLKDYLSLEIWEPTIPRHSAVQTSQPALQGGSIKEPDLVGLLECFTARERALRALDLLLG